MANGSAPQWVTLTNFALLPGGSSADALTNVAGSLFVAQTPESFTYDADGNLTDDGRWTNTWDAENRLASLVARTTAGPQQYIAFQY